MNRCIKIGIAKLRRGNCGSSGKEDTYFYLLQWERIFLVQLRQPDNFSAIVTLLPLHRYPATSPNC